MQTVLVSRFPESLTPDALPVRRLPAGLVSIVPHETKPGALVVVFWSWSLDADDYRQVLTADVKDLDEAFTYVPARAAILAVAPPGCVVAFALEVQ